MAAPIDFGASRLADKVQIKLSDTCHFHNPLAALTLLNLFFQWAIITVYMSLNIIGSILMAVPPILSQTWKSHDLPARAHELSKQWVRLNPGLERRLYDDKDARAVVAQIAPHHIDAYDAMPFAVMRADVFRLSVLVRDGGIYADIDMQPLRRLPADLFTRPCSVSIEAHLGRTRQRELGFQHNIQIANCILAAEPNQPFLIMAIERAFALFAAIPNPHVDQIEDITGPKMLTRLLQENPLAEVWVGSQIQLMAPLHYRDLWPINRHMVARHETHGTWKQAAVSMGAIARLKRQWIERNRTVNPFAAPAWHPASELWGQLNG